MNKFISYDFEGFINLRKLFKVVFHYNSKKKKLTKQREYYQLKKSQSKYNNSSKY